MTEMDTTQDRELEAIQATIAAKKADVAHQGTRMVYDKHVKDFLEWSRLNGYADGMVSPDKFIRFMHEVQDRKKQRPGRKRMATSALDNENDSDLGKIGPKVIYYF